MKKPAYSAALDRVLFRASRLARELGGAQTGTEHLLLALSQERISQTGRILCCTQHPLPGYVLIPQRSRRWGILQRRYRSPRTDQRR